MAETYHSLFQPKLIGKTYYVKKQENVDKTNIRKNKGRRNYGYKVGDLVLSLNKNTLKGKLEPTTLPDMVV